MKVLTNHATGAALVFPLDGDQWLGLDRSRAEKGVVGELSEGTVRLAVREALRLETVDSADPFAYMEESEVMRDLRWLAKALMDVAVGAEVGMKRTSKGFSLDVPKDARPNRSAGLAKGDAVAVGPNVSPKTLMNSHGVLVTAVKNGKAEVEFDAGDMDRLQRATGKKYANPMRLSVTMLERA